MNIKQFGSDQPWPNFSDQEISIATDILRSGKVNYWTGDQGKLFEKEFADYIGVNYAIAVANGTLALELALIGLGISKNDEVIVPSRTYFATASSVAVIGAKPVVADIDRDSGNITVETIDAMRTSNTKAIIVVHLAGWPCNMKSIISYAKKHNLLIIEDCAQAHGAEYDSKKIGSFGDASAFSFCQDKIMTTCGEGGMVLFNNEHYWRKAWSYNQHGKNFDSVHSNNHPAGFRWLIDSFGSNYRMTEVQSGVGRYQLKKLDKWVKVRETNAAILDSFFKKFSLLRIPTKPNNISHAYYKYYIYINTEYLKEGFSRDSIMSEFNNAGIPCFSGSCSEIYLENAFKEFGYNSSNRLSVAKELGETSLVFLIDPTLSESDMYFICEVGEDIINNATV